MPLVDLKSDLTNLPWGKDRRGGGSSGQPYITKDIPVEENDLPINTEDFLLRNGIRTIPTALEDVGRMTKFMFDTRSPKGLLFTAKQNLLSRTSVKTEGSRGLGYGGGGVNQGIYNPLNTIAQAGIVAGGGHLNFLGIDGTVSDTGGVVSSLLELVGLEDVGTLGLRTYSSVISKQTSNNYDTHNRLVLLNNTVFPENPIAPGLGNTLIQETLLNSGFGQLLNQITDTFDINLPNLNIKSASLPGVPGYTLNSNFGNNVMSYKGGPGSTLGIGETHIRYADQRTGVHHKEGKKILSGTYQVGRQRQLEYRHEDLLKGKREGRFGFNETIKDKEIKDVFGNYYLETPSNISKENNFNHLGVSKEEYNEEFISGKLTTDKVGFDELGNPLPQRNMTPNGVRPIPEENNSNYLGVSKEEYNEEFISGKLEKDKVGFDGEGNPLSSKTTPVSDVRPTPEENNFNHLGVSKEEYKKQFISGKLEEDKVGFDGNGNATNSNKNTPHNTEAKFEDQYKRKQTEEDDTRYLGVNDRAGLQREFHFRGNKAIHNKDFTYEESKTYINNFIDDDDKRKNLIRPKRESLISQTIYNASPDYVNKNIDNRLNMGTPGDNNRDRSYYALKDDAGYDAYNVTPLDKLTAQYLIDTGDSTNFSPLEDYRTDDLCKFRIASMDNDRADGSAVYMLFRAFLDDFSDNYNATWNAVNYVGRGDTLYNYSGFTRSVNVSFKVAAQSKGELMPMYYKLNYLASTLTPDYNTGGIMRGNLLRLTVGGYLYEQPGFISSLTYTVPQESPWEIAIDNEGGVDESVKELPHVINCNFNFTPIHDFLPQKFSDITGNTLSPENYIALKDGVSNNYNDLDKYINRG
jgi:hypothetical protein